MSPELSDESLLRDIKNAFKSYTNEIEWRKEMFKQKGLSQESQKTNEKILKIQFADCIFDIFKLNSAQFLDSKE